MGNIPIGSIYSLSFIFQCIFRLLQYVDAFHTNNVTYYCMQGFIEVYRIWNYLIFRHAMLKLREYNLFLPSPNNRLPRHRFTTYGWNVLDHTTPHMCTDLWNKLTLTTPLLKKIDNHRQTNPNVAPFREFFLRTHTKTIVSNSSIVSISHFSSHCDWQHYFSNNINLLRSLNSHTTCRVW